MKKLGTLEEVREEFDKNIVLAQKDDEWFMLLGGKKAITNHDIRDAFIMFMKFTVDMYEKSGISGKEAIIAFRKYLDDLEAGLFD